MKPIEYRLPKHKQPFFTFVKGLLKIVYRKIDTVVLGEPLQDKAIYLANHANKMGPVMYEMFFPVYTVKWGAHQMLGSYSERKQYLRDVLYIQKNGMGKRRAAFKATFEAFFSQFFYRGMKFLPTYPDMRLVKTVKKSVDVLNDNTAIMIYPEDSNDGYNDEMTNFFSGFALVMENYYKKNKEDVPVRCIYYHKKKRIMTVSESYYLQDFIAKGFDRNAIAQFMKDRVNQLYYAIEAGEFDNKSKKTN